MAVFIDEETREAFVEFITEEINKADAEVSQRKHKWIKWRELREAKANERPKTHPYPKSANMTVPLTATISQGVSAKILSSFLGRNPPWIMRPLSPTDVRPDDKDLAEFGTRYFKILAESRSDLSLTEVQTNVIYEATTMGTGYVKVPWVNETVSFKVDSGGVVEEKDRILHVGPRLDVIDQENLLYRRMEGKDFQKQPFVAHRIRLAKHELENRRDTATYENVEDILDWSDSETPEHIQRQEDEQGINEQHKDMYEIFEVFAYFDADGDGRNEDVVVTLHLPTGTVLREGFNEIGIRPFKALRYFPRPFFVEGRGICEMSESMQEEASTFHRMRVDNAHIVGVRMFAVQKDAGIKPNEAIYPGKLWFVEDPSRDIRPIQGGEVYPSSLQAEQLATEYAQRVTGFSDVMGGFADQTLRSRDTFAGQSLRLNQGQGILGAISTGMQSDWSDIAMLVFFQLVANKERVIRREEQIGRLTQDEIEKLELLLSIPIENLPTRFSFSVRTTKLDQTFETKRQNILALTQLYQQYWQQVLPMMGQVFGPQAQSLPEVMRSSMMKAIVGYSKLQEEVFKLFDMEDTERYIPEHESLELLTRIQDLQKEPLVEMMRGVLNAGEQRNIEGQAGQLGPGGPGPVTGAVTNAGVVNDQQALEAQPEPGAGEVGVF